MSAPAKYLFDVDFAAPRAPSTVALAEHSAALAEAETRGYRNGFTAAEAEAAAETARRLTIALERVATSLEKIAQGLTGIEHRLEAEAVEVAVAVARKLAPELIAHEPFAELSALVTDCFRHVTASPHVVVRVPDALYPQAHERLQDIARKVGFEGRLVVLAEPEMGPGDCRIEWADGGVTRDFAVAQWLGDAARCCDGRRCLRCVVDRRTRT